jgi:hypothetical protein
LLLTWVFFLPPFVLFLYQCIFILHDRHATCE